MAKIFNSYSSESKEHFQNIFHGGGEMGERIRSFDWSKTSLGPLTTWSKTLQIAVNLILQSPAPMFILWGAEGVSIYNDAYSVFAGKRHPDLLGSKCEESWPEVTNFLTNVKNKCLKGEILSFEKTSFTVFRNTYPESIWLDLHCSPIIDDNGQPGGVLVINIEITETIKSVQALKESEERYRLIAEGTTDGIWDYDVKTGIAIWNDRLFEILGYSKEEVGTPGIVFLQTIIHPEDKPKVLGALNETLNKGTYYEAEYRAQQQDGNYIYLHAKGKPLFDENGLTTRILGVTINITERKKAEQALKESEERFSSIFNQTSVGIAQTDLTGKFVLANDRFCEMVGRTKEEIYQMRLEHLTHPEDLKAKIWLFHRAVKEGIPFKLEKRFIHSDGSEIWVNNNVSLIKDPEGKPLYLTAVCQDITERKKAEYALHESEVRFRTMAEASGILIAHTNENGREVYFNKEWLQLTGESMEALVDNGWFVLLHPEDRDSFVQAYKSAFEKREVLKREFRLKSQKGEYRWQLGVFSPRIDPNGSFAGYISSCVDITEPKLIEKRLEEKNSELILTNNDLDNFIYTASHDLRAPISNLEGLLQAVVTDHQYDDEQGNLIEMMFDSIKRFKSTIKDLTEISKVQRNEHEDLEVLNFAEILDEIKLDIRELIKRYDPEIQPNFEVLTIHYSRKNLRSIIYNLISNAIKYSSPDRKPIIKITTRKIDSCITLIVSDNGLGLNPKDLEKVFGMFKRAHQHVEGSGVGLYVIKRIIENAGGEIEIQSEVGKGTSFFVKLKGC